MSNEMPEPMTVARVVAMTDDHLTMLVVQAREYIKCGIYPGAFNGFDLIMGEFLYRGLDLPPYTPDQNIIDGMERMKQAMADHSAMHDDHDIAQWNEELDS